MSEIAASEAFVRAYHARWPGVTGAAYARGRDPGGRSSYDLLAAAVRGRVRVLDLGCGASPLAGAIGIDLSIEELRLAGPRVVQARMETLPFADATFDACASHLAFSILRDPEPAAREIARVLVPGGVFAIVTGGAPAPDDETFDLVLRLARASASAPTPRLGDRRTRSREGLDAILAPRFAPCAWTSHTIDLGGAAEDVWITLSTLYELSPLDDDQRARLRDDFLTHAGRGRVPCAMRIAVATAARTAAVG
ncbi:MAG TPA: class I SAM-dependent methyltransferase [Kofleriaceae bacterium]|nr:class I SAM-dependent methyltransferase [Kofleriaceae bacterium]